MAFVRKHRQLNFLVITVMLNSKVLSSSSDSFLMS